jgi:hypothetical protein
MFNLFKRFRCPLCGHKASEHLGEISRLYYRGLTYCTARVSKVEKTETKANGMKVFTSYWNTCGCQAAEYEIINHYEALKYEKKHYGVTFITRGFQRGK